MNRELLEWLLHAATYHRDADRCDDCKELIEAINAELAKPEPVEYGWIKRRRGLTMPLPNDVSRFKGERLQICPRRETC